MRVVYQVFGFMRFWPCDHPSNRAIPYEVHDPRAWTTFQIDRGNIAVDGLLRSLHEFRLNIFKLFDFHSMCSAYSGTAAMASISTKNSGFARPATYMTVMAGGLGWRPQI